MTRETVDRTHATPGITSDATVARAGWFRAAGRVLPAVAVAAIAVQFFGLYRAGGTIEAELFSGVDKVQHLLGFALPVFLVLLTLWWPRGTRTAGISRRLGVLVTVAFLAQAVVSELVQGYLLPTRSGDPLDGVADSLGIALGWGGFVFVARAWGRRRG